MINCNPETFHRLRYFGPPNFEPLTLEDVLPLSTAKSAGVIVQFADKRRSTGLELKRNVCDYRHGAESIDLAEDRRVGRLLDEMKIPQPRTARRLFQEAARVHRNRFPVLVRRVMCWRTPMVIAYDLNTAGVRRPAARWPGEPSDDQFSKRRPKWTWTRWRRR